MKLNFLRLVAAAFALAIIAPAAMTLRAQTQPSIDAPLAGYIFMSGEFGGDCIAHDDAEC